MKISVIIPALNEEQAIGSTLEALAAEAPAEVIVVDGGSRDRTREIAARHATVLACEPGRARQMNAGARHARGEAYLFLHADTRLPPGGLERVAQALGEGGRRAGRFRVRFDDPHPLLALYAFQTRFPFFSYGDQAFFLTRELFGALGGFREDAVFEDIDFYRRLSRIEKPLILPDAVTTSARRFIANGLGRQKWVNIALVSLYTLGCPAARLSRLKEAWYRDIR